MGIEIAKGGSPRPSPLPTGTTAARTTAPQAPSSGTAAPADTVVLSPQAQALKTLQSMTGTAPGGAPGALAPDPAEKTEAERKAEEVFMEAVKIFFTEHMGLDKSKAGNVQLNREALQYILRNTVIGALAPPSLLKEHGLGFGQRAPAPNGGLAEVTIGGRGDEPPLARVAFDPAAMEEMARLPRKKKDTDRDGLFTHLDLMPGARELSAGSRIANGPRFEEVEKRHAAEGDVGGNRFTLSDGGNRPFFMTRLRGDVENGRLATANMAFGLLQFAGFAP